MAANTSPRGCNRRRYRPTKPQPLSWRRETLCRDHPRTPARRVHISCSAIRAAANALPVLSADPTVLMRPPFAVAAKESEMKTRAFLQSALLTDTVVLNIEADASSD